MKSFENEQIEFASFFSLYFRAEREKYYKHGLTGKKDPDKYLSLIVNEMDQSKHNLPNFNAMTKVRVHEQTHMVSLH